MRHVPPPHLPAADLGLTEDELHALLWVTERLEDGRIGDDEFDMECVSRGRCGSACCIAGWMATQLDHNPYVHCTGTPAEALFVPPTAEREINGQLFAIMNRGWTAGPKAAARACRQFLQTGRVDWDAAIDGAP